MVLFASRSLEPAERAPYQHLIDAGIIRPFYLDEMPELENAPLGLSILYLIGQTESKAPESARNLIARARTEIADEALRANLIELIETIIIYKLSQLSRKEIEAMLQIQDIRQSRVYQEAKEEGKEEGLKEGVEKERQRTIARMAASKKSAEEIASVLGIDVELVRKAIAANH